MRTRTFFALSWPAIAVMAGLLIVPLTLTFIWSFQNVPVGQPGVFIGLDNYREILGNKRFWDAAGFTVGIAIMLMVLKVSIGYAIALVLNKARYGQSVFLGILLATYVVPTVVGALDFSWLFNDVFGGPVNNILAIFGIQIEWLVDMWPARALVLMHSLWHELPFAILILYAGLQTLNKETLEAADLDGTNWWQRQRYIILPGLARFFTFVGLISMMDALKIFDSIRIITPAASQVGTESLMTYVYQIALNDSYRLGTASTVNLLTLLLTFVLLIPFLRSSWRDSRSTS